MIELQNVSKYYNRVRAVNDVSFTVQTGEIVGLLGPNGAGKTTVMKMITGYHNADTGSVLVNDIDVLEHPIQAKTNIGYLPENNPLYTDLFVEEYLRFIGFSRGVPALEIDEAINRVVSMCALSDFFYRPINSLSKGMKQRVGLAQAIIHDPDVVILDEPTSGLDPIQIKEIRELIRKMGETKTVILSTHILQEVEALCSHILILNKGRIVVKGTNDEIAAKMKGGDSYSLVFAENIGKEHLDSLKQLQGVESLSAGNRSEDSQTTSVQLTGSSNSLKGEDIFDWAVKNKLRLAELYKRSASLENVFESITTDEGEDA